MPQKSTEKIFRYPGARPFTTGQKNIFFGRKKDIRDLYRLINVEQLVVLYSKSGMGKSSLLNAGILPKINQQGRFEPITVRFGAYTSQQTTSPVDICLQSLQPESINNTLLQKISPEENSLWSNIMQRWIQTANRKGFLLVFDQFEELFTYPVEAIEAFKEQLVELLNTDIPHNIRETLEEKLKRSPEFISEEELELLHTPFELKVVMAIRSDRMSLMAQMADYLPNILSNCYELDALSPEGAEDAILNPAFKNDANFASPPFDYTDDIIEKILSFLTNKGGQKIESFQLQILCQYIERKVIDKELKLVKASDIGQLEVIYKNYYNDQIASLGNEEEQYLARILIEDGLIFEEEERRLSMYEGQIYKSFGLSSDLLRKLVDTHLLRAEPSMRGGYTYELSHDTLVAPILRARKIRKAEEEKLAAQKIRQQQEQEMEVLRLQAKEEKQKRRRYMFIAIFGVLLALLALGASAIAYNYYFKALEQSRLARENERKAQHNLAMLNKEQQQRISANYNEYLTKGKALMEQARYGDAIQELKTALAFNNEGKEAQQLIEESRVKNQDKLIFEQYIEEGDSLLNLGPDTFIDALEKYRRADSLEYDSKETDRKISFVTARLEGAFVKFVEDGEIFYRAEGYAFALQKFQQAQRIKPYDEEVKQKIMQCKARL